MYVPCGHFQQYDHRPNIHVTLRVIEPTVQPTAADDIVSLGIKLSPHFWIRELNGSYKGKGSNFTGMKGTNKPFNLLKVNSHKNKS